MEELYLENAQIVYYFIYKQCGNKELAEEITQETFLRAMQSIEKYDYSCKVSVWLCSIAKHIYWQYLRKYNREIPTEFMEFETENGCNVEQTVLDKCELDEVISEMKRLPGQMREVIYLRASAGLSFREIGEILGKSENWARVTFYRGKETLLKRRKQNET